MTTPFQAAPDGAITVGGGTWNYGQTMTEDIGRAAFEFPMPTFDNMLDLLRLALERLPIEALQPWADFLGIVDGLFDSVGAAVDAIIGGLVDNVKMTVQAFDDWLGEFFAPLKEVFDQLMEILSGAVVDPINDALAGVVNFLGNFLTELPEWLLSIQPTLTWLGSILSSAMQTVFVAVLDFFNWIGEGIGIPTVQDILQFFSDMIGSLGNLDVFAAIAEFFNDLVGSLGSGVWAFLSDVIEFLGSGIWGFVETIIGFLQWVWGLIGVDALTEITNLFNFIKGLLSFSSIQVFIDDIADFFTGLLNPTQFVELFKNAFSFLNWLFAQFSGAVESVLKPLLTFLKGVWDTFGSPVLNQIKDLFESIMGFLNFSAIQGFIEDIADFFTGILNPSQFVELFKNVFSFFDGFISSFGNFNILATVADFFSDAIDSFGSMLEWAGSLITLQFETLWNWIQDVVVRPFVRALTGLDVPDLGALATWARDLLTGASPLNALRLFGTIPAALLGIIPVSNIGLDSPNLLSQGSFKVAEGVIEDDGWSWDDTQNRSGDGGSAKAVCDGTTRMLYSTQSIPVAEDQVIETSCFIRTSGYSGGGTAIQMALIPFSGNTALPAIVTAARGGSTSWVEMEGSPYTVPNNVTSVRLFLRVTSSATAGTVWWDDVSLKKTGKMAQGLVASLINAWEGIWNGVFGSGGIGKIWSDVEGALSALSEVADTAAGDASEAAGTAAATLTNLYGSPELGDEIVIGQIPTNDVGAAINPSSGSGAQVSRRSTSNVGASPGRVNFPTDFFDTTDTSSSDITITRSSGTFTVTQNGWYLVELAFRLNPVISFGFSIAPLLFRNGSPYKIGNDAIMGTWGIGSVGNRYANSTWIVYLTAGESVRAGYDAIGTGLDMFDADASGVETYFSIAMLNKTFA